MLFLYPMLHIIGKILSHVIGIIWNIYNITENMHSNDDIEEVCRKKLLLGKLGELILLANDATPFHHLPPIIDSLPALPLPSFSH